MSKAQKIKICSKCSGIGEKQLKEVVKEKHLKDKCIGMCLKKHPELEGKVFGYIGDGFVVCSTREDFISKVAETTDEEASRPEKAAEDGMERNGDRHRDRHEKKEKHKNKDKDKNKDKCKDKGKDKEKHKDKERKKEKDKD